MDEQDFWKAIDHLAKNQGISLTRLAKRAGLDPTSLNPSKRAFPNGKVRSISTKTLTKILTVSQTSLGEFVRIIEETKDPHGLKYFTTLPLYTWQMLSRCSNLENILPTNRRLGITFRPQQNSDEIIVVRTPEQLIDCPFLQGPHNLVLERYSQGEENDLVVVRMKDSTLKVGQLQRRTMVRTHLQQGHTLQVIDSRDIFWVARIAALICFPWAMESTVSDEK